MKLSLVGAQTIGAFCVAWIMLFGSSVQADIFVETFDGPLNPVFWDVDTGGNDWLVNNGKLTITRTNGNQGQLVFLPQLSGDFEVQFDYSLNWTSTFAFGDRLQLTLASDAPIHSYTVGHAQEGFLYGVAVDPNPRFVFGPNLSTGVMRVSRTGSSVLMQYLENGQWVTLQTASDSRDMWVSMGNFIFNGFISGSSVEIDNFRIVADRFSTSIPEPGLSAMLLGGLGLLLSSRRHRRTP